MEVEVRGEAFHLLPEKLLFWPRRSLLAVADLHLGKAEIFQRQGLWLPSQPQKDDLELLSRVADRLQARHILFLGDLVHHVRSVPGEIEKLFARWIEAFPGEITVTLGNHDRGLDRKWPSSWDRVQRLASVEIDSFVFRHEVPEALSPKDPFVWAGHLHPVVTISDGADRLRLPCFVLGETNALLPAFSRLAGGFEVRPSEGRKIYAVGPERVIPWARARL